MRLRGHRRPLVVWSPPDGYCVPRLTHATRTGWVHRFIRTGAVLMVTGLRRLAHAVRPRWRPLLSGAVLTAAGLMLRGGAWSAILFPGLLLLLSTLLIPASPDADRGRRSALERELAGYATPAQRRDLEAMLERYPDSVTRELRDILAFHATASGDTAIPGSGGH